MSSVKKKLLKPEIIYQDKYIFLVNKPSGWVTLRVKTYDGITLQDWVKNKVGEVREVRKARNLSGFVRRSGIAHRLDKDTWGLVLGAKDKKSFKKIQKQFKQRQIKKEYLALVRGSLQSEGKVVSPVGRLSYNKLKYGVRPFGKPAETKFEPIKQYVIGGEAYTLVRVWPKTGRTHQIRVHFKYLGHPVFGDALYGGKKEENKDMFLVAKKLKFTHPKEKEKLSFEVGLPKLLEDILKNAQETKKK